MIVNSKPPQPQGQRVSTLLSRKSDRSASRCSGFASMTTSRIARSPRLKWRGGSTMIQSTPEVLPRERESKHRKPREGRAFGARRQAQASRSAAARSPLTPIPHVLTFQTGGRDPGRGRSLSPTSRTTEAAAGQRRLPSDVCQPGFCPLKDMRGPDTLTVGGAGHARNHPNRLRTSIERVTRAGAGPTDRSRLLRRG